MLNSPELIVHSRVCANSAHLETWRLAFFGTVVAASLDPGAVVWAPATVALNSGDGPISPQIVEVACDRIGQCSRNRPATQVKVMNWYPRSSPRSHKIPTLPSFSTVNSE